MAIERDPERARQIRRLHRLGMPLDAATAAVDEDRVALTLMDHLLSGPRRLDRGEAARRAGVDDDLARTVERLGGTPDGRRYTEGDVRQLALVGRLAHLLGEDEVLAQLRGDAAMLRSMALRTLDTGEATFIRAAREELEDEVELGVRLAEVAGPLLDLGSELVAQSYRRTVLGLLTSDVVVQALRGGTETVEIAVGFVDVVGYTSLSGRIDPTGLDEVLDAFERACQAVAEATDRVQLVKFLGDAAMYVSLDPVALTAGVLDLVEHVEEDGALPEAPVRGGIAAGPALLRGGDYFGTPVNEAARLTDLARRGTVLASSELGEALDDAFRLRRTRPMRLHGIGVRRPYRVRAAEG